MEDGSTGLMSAGQGVSYGTVSTGASLDESVDVGAATAAEEERRGAEPAAAAAAGRSAGEKAAIALCVLAPCGLIILIHWRSY